MPKVVKFVETETEWWLPGIRGMGEKTVVKGYRECFSFARSESSGDLFHNMNILNNTELKIG